MDALNNIRSIVLTPLRRIDHPKGAVFHGLKRSEQSFVDFGEVYFTTVIANETKGWKKHTLMTLNLIVPLGMVRFYVRDSEQDSAKVFDIGADNYQRLTIPPGYWVAFKGLTSETNLVLNVASIEHDPAEAINVPLETFPLPQ